MRRNACKDCQKRRPGCRRECEENAVEEIVAVLFDKRDTGRDADGFLADQRRRRRERWNIKNLGRH